MPKKKHTRATQFQQLAQSLEKALGLGGKKTHKFIENLSKDLGPLLSELEDKILATRSIPIGLMKDIGTNYIVANLRSMSQPGQ